MSTGPHVDKPTPMTGDLRWLTSTRDSRIHAFRDSGTYLEALCTHTVPAGQALDSAATPTPPKCGDCLIRYGQAMTGGDRLWGDD